MTSGESWYSTLNCLLNLQVSTASLLEVSACKLSQGSARSLSYCNVQHFSFKQ